MCPGTSLAEHCFVASQWRCCPWEESLRVQGKLVDSFQHGLWMGKEGNMMQYDGKVSGQLTTLFVCLFLQILTCMKFIWNRENINKCRTRPWLYFQNWCENISSCWYHTCDGVSSTKHKYWESEPEALFS